ncbi:MAG: hypothetical protein ABIF18_03160 [archaeon]
MCLDNFYRLYYALMTNFGTKKKVDEINRRNLEKVKNKEGRLIILLHGMFANYYRNVYSSIKLLKQEDIDVISVGYNYNDSLEVSAKKVGKDIESLMKKSGVKSIDIIGLCGGGLVGRYYAEGLGGSKNIDKFISVYSPAKVMPSTELGFKLNKLLGGKPWKYNSGLREIKDKNSIKDYLLLYSVDDKIIPPKYTKIKGARRKKMRGPHLLLSYSPKILKEVANFLREGRMENV